VTSTQRIYLALADLTLIVHFAFVAFVVGGLLLIWIGRIFHWAFVRNVRFRLAHLAAIGFVAVEAVTGFVCPLTTWEDKLRLLAGGQERYQGSFVQHWLHQVLFFDVDRNIFAVSYVVFFLAVAVSLWSVPPQWRRQAARSDERRPHETHP
jgi:hypothetical protein